MKQHFQAAYGLTNRHLQTIYPSLFRRQTTPPISCERFELADGDFVDCYWHETIAAGGAKGIVVLFHGLEGSFQSHYIQAMMHALGKAGFHSVLMHFRGCSKEMNRLPRSYHSGDTDDAKAWINYLQHTYPDSPLYAIGYSLGGNMLLKLLGEWAGQSPLKAAVSVSAPLQLDICASQMNRGLARFYQHILLGSLKRHLLKKYQLHDMHSLLGLSRQQVRQLASFWAFDEAYTAPIHGFNSAIDYYHQASARQYLAHIHSNTLIIHALDDPFMNLSIVPEQHELSDAIQLELHPQGGHLGFVSGQVLAPQYWLEQRIVHYLNSHTN